MTVISTNTDILARLAQSSLPPYEPDDSTSDKTDNTSTDNTSTDLSDFGDLGYDFSKKDFDPVDDALDAVSDPGGYFGDLDTDSLKALGEYGANELGQFGLDQFDKVPGVSSALSSGLNSLTHGADLDNAIADALKSGALDLAGMLLDKVAPGYGNTLAGLLSSGLQNPDKIKSILTSAGLKTLGGLLSNLGLPGIGGWLFNEFVGPAIDDSLKDSFLGDMIDDRTLENLRDTLEDQGLSYEESAKRAQDEMDRVKNNDLETKSHLDDLKDIEQNRKDREAKNAKKSAEDALADDVDALDRATNVGDTSDGKLSDSLSDQERQALEHQLTTNAGVQDYADKYGLTLDDADTAASEARGHAGLDSFGSIDPGEHSSDEGSGGTGGGGSSGSSPGDLGSDKGSDSDGGGGWW